MGNHSEFSEFQSSISKTNDIILGVLYSLFGVCSLTGNTVLLIVAYRKRSMLKPAEFFIANLAISDLGMTGTLLPLAIPSLFAHRWLFDQRICQYYAFCGVLFGLCSLTNLTALSCVCCMKVCYPAYGNRFSSSHSRVLLFCVWTYAFVFAAAPLVDWGIYGPEPYGTACCIDWKASHRNQKAIAYIVTLFVLCYIIPCVLILISYTLILLTVRGSRQAVRQHLSPQAKGNSVHSLIVKVSVAVCIGFLLAWTPYAVVAMWSVANVKSEMSSLVFAIAAAFAKSSTLYNPVVYLLLKPNFLSTLTQDLALLQSMCTIICQGCNPAKRTFSLATKVKSSTKTTDNFRENQGSCRSCNDTFECFRKYPRCCNFKHMDNVPPMTITVDGNPTNIPQSVRGKAVHLIVYSSRTRSGADITEVAAGRLPTDYGKDFI
ncbi:opsin-5-like [Bombina bombina]|uniref:opsin-5-like n=1 Tax=Bombina bombina TaxID=8345 RepID=UPI00235A4ABA|nr:opsin-5-like [Bombina bombina]